MFEIVSAFIMILIYGLCVAAVGLELQFSWVWLFLGVIYCSTVVLACTTVLVKAFKKEATRGKSEK